MLVTNTIGYAGVSSRRGVLIDLLGRLRVEIPVGKPPLACIEIEFRNSAQEEIVLL